MTDRPAAPPLSEYLHRRAARLGTPLSGTFELTPCCNLDCKMCYVRLTPEQQRSAGPLRTAREWLDLGRQARDAGMLFLLLTGGEPFLRPDLPALVRGLQRLGLVLSINTNGTLIDERAVAWLRKSPPARVNLTLYGAGRETYRRLCGDPEAYDRAIRAIGLLRGAGISVKLNCCLTPENAGDLDAISAFARREGLPLQATSYVFPPLRRDGSLAGRNFRFSPEEAAYQAARIACLERGEAAFLRRAEELSAGEAPECPGAPGEMTCRAGKCSFWVTWDGRMLPCGMLPGGEDAFALGFDSAWTRVKARSAAIRLPEACGTCALRERCGVCPAVACTESGRFDAVPAYRCQMTRAYPEACRRLVGELRRKGERDR